MVSTWEALVLDGLFNSVFVISPQKKASCSKHEENRRGKNYTVSGTMWCIQFIQFQEPYTNILR